MVLAALVAAVILMFVLPRRYASACFLFVALLTPYGQNLYLWGVHFSVIRILILAGFARVILSKPRMGEFLPGGFSLLDKVFLLWAFYRALSVILVFGRGGAVLNQCGFLLDAVGGYFLLRSMIRSERDIATVVKVFAAVALISAAGMIREYLSGQNVFALLGGIRATPEWRNGRVRAQGPFAISIAAGTFGATAFPLFLWLWNRGRAKITAIVGALAATTMVFLSGSSTPVLAWLGGILAIGLWPARNYMRAVRWGIVFALIGLQIVMKAPVWFVISHIDLGGSSWERANLIDTCIRHFRDWWLIGTHDNVNWGWDMWDQCNQFVSEAETGGIVALGCFIAMLTLCFRTIGKARRAVRNNIRMEWMFWLLGAMLFAQLMAFMGIDYFDQSTLVWQSILVMIPTAALALQKRLPTRANDSTTAEEHRTEQFAAPVTAHPVLNR